MDGDVELIQFLHRLAGYALWGANPEQVVAILHGSGSNGKSTFVSALQQVLGDYVRQVDPTSLMTRRNQNGGGPRDDLVRLYRARLAVSVESGEGDSLDEGLIKTVSGGDHIYARAMYAKQGIEFDGWRDQESSAQSNAMTFLKLASHLGDPETTVTFTCYEQRRRPAMVFRQKPADELA